MHIALLGRADDPALRRLQREMETAAHTCTRLDADTDPAHISAGPSLDALVLDLSSWEVSPQAVAALVSAAHRDRYVPVLGLLDPRQVDTYDGSLELDDFLVHPPKVPELVTRIRQASRRDQDASGEDVIRLGDLRIDLGRYEVWVADREVALTFKEYELLRLLASSPGRVFTRQILLDRVWGYEYFGGTRTVDVHVRRLRSKLEDPHHTFVETVRNVGYRLKTD